jgi:hypothetical protein
MVNLWYQNTPQKFWLCHPEPSEEIWLEAVQRSLPVFGNENMTNDVANILALILGEGQFGPNHFQLSPVRKFYYQVKPLLPQLLRTQIKRIYACSARKDFPLNWPIEDRYVRFLWEIIRQLMIIQDQSEISFRAFWPHGYRFALVLTHDVETAKGQDESLKVAALEESLGLRSSFNFIPGTYPIDWDIIKELRRRGFEIGIHGLNHDGKLFLSKTEFTRRSQKINYYLETFNAVGFRSPLMHRNPEWLQSLHIEYDLSFFDTDPYQPMPGGCMNIWPFVIGKFVELPYTLPQDCTLSHVLKEETPRIWLEKLRFIERNLGLALVNTHPDYLIDAKIWNIYVEFLRAVTERKNYWNALPNAVSRWWRRRVDTPLGNELLEMNLSTIHLENDHLILDFNKGIIKEEP